MVTEEARHFSVVILVNTINSWSIIKYFIHLFGLVVLLVAGICKVFIMCYIIYCTIFTKWAVMTICCVLVVFFECLFSEELDVAIGGWFHGMILILLNFRVILFIKDTPQQTTHDLDIYDLLHVQNKYFGFVYTIICISKPINN